MYEGDSYIIWLTEVGTKCLRIAGIHRYRNNQNSEAEEVDFYDLDDTGRSAVIRQIQRRYAMKSVIPQ
jgi:hypothetical protein